MRIGEKAKENEFGNIKRAGLNSLGLYKDLNAIKNNYFTEQKWEGYIFSVFHIPLIKFFPGFLPN